MTRDPSDYSWLPADLRAFIAMTDADYPPDAVTLSMARQRAVYDTSCARFDQPHPPGLRTEDRTIAGVPCRRYIPTAPRADVTGVYFHGGGFVVGGLHSHDSIVADLAEAAQVTLIAVDYRLAPEHRHPAHYDDCVAVVDALDGPLVLVGDSAGGSLAASICATRPGRIRGQVLIYPGLTSDADMPSMIRHAHAPMLTAADCLYYHEIRFDGPPPRGDVTAEALAATDYSDLPPTAIFTAEADPLASHGVEYAARLAEAGVPVSLTEEPGLVHGYLRARTLAEGARASFERIARALDTLAHPAQ
ncbi:MAG: alpha/beta hydrolase [Rhodobacteraceae bacterium]|nr:alpha/beta hydrolase [Paracoccaceae bacterium]